MKRFGIATIRAGALIALVVWFVGGSGRDVRAAQVQSVVITPGQGSAPAAVISTISGTTDVTELSGANAVEFSNAPPSTITDASAAAGTTTTTTGTTSDLPADNNLQSPGGELPPPFYVAPASPEVLAKRAEAAKKRTQEHLTKIQQLTFDRRPSTILRVWSEAGKPKQPAQASININTNTTSSAPASATATATAKPAARPAAAGPVAMTKAVALRPAIRINPTAIRSAGTTSAIRIGASTATASGKSSTVVLPDGRNVIIPDGVDPGEILNAVDATASTANAESELFDKQLVEFQKYVTMSDWNAVGAFLQSLPETERLALYQRLIQALPQSPNPMSFNAGMSAADMAQMQMQMQTSPQGMQYLEKNVFSNADVLALADIAPQGVGESDLTGLGAILQLALSQGSVIEDFLTRTQTLFKNLPPDIADQPRALQAGFWVVPRPSRPALTKRQLAQVLIYANHAEHIQAFLPLLADAEKSRDLSALNMLAQYFLAVNAKSEKAQYLEDAWKATQSILALTADNADASRDNPKTVAAKNEALKRAVDLAPRIKDELGQAWLEASFTKNPDRGMEILTNIGGGVSQGISKTPMNPDQRQRTLELMHAAVNALLKADPQNDKRWSRSLTLLAGAWLKEAEMTRQLDQSSFYGPRMRRDSYGNMFYMSDDMGFNPNMMQNPNMPRPVPIDKLLPTRPSVAWLERIDQGLRTRLEMIFTQLLLKVGEETEAFPYIANLAKSHPEQAEPLVKEFLEVWIRNHDLNSDRQRTNPYMFMFGFERRSESIPLTRSKQERNLEELSGWVKKIRELPLKELDEPLLIKAFTTSHSSAEVYKLSDIESIFGPAKDLKPATLAGLVQQMRGNLATLWQAPAVQEQNKTKRKKQDIQAEVLRGYLVAREVVDQGLKQHPQSWELVQASAALAHDELNYRQELQRTSDFRPQRDLALSEFARAAALYQKAAPALPEDKQTIEPYLQWFYASLGACELKDVDEEKQPDMRQFPKIAEAVKALGGDLAKEHLGKFANSLFTRMSAVNPAVKFRYLQAGFSIVGDQEQAREAKKVYDYYHDLVKELQLQTVIDGPDTVKAGQPFGVFVQLRHTREIERESGGFGRYLQNQQASTMYYYNYGRPLTNYRDKFQEVVKAAIDEHFELLSVTFQTEDVTSKATDEYGWRITPYAYLLVKARGPEVDRLPPLRMDLDFLDTSGYVILPLESKEIPLNAKATSPTLRPVENLQVTQTLDERQAKNGKLILEVKATGKGLIPELDQILKVDSPGFEIVNVDDQGLSIVEFEKESADTAVRSERQWMVSLQAKSNAEKRPTTFQFAAPRNPDNPVKLEYQRYDDADLAKTDANIVLNAAYGKTRGPSPWWLFGGIIPVLAVIAARRSWVRPPKTLPCRFAVPDAVTPFTVLALLRDIERNNGLSPERKAELLSTIQDLETNFFVKPIPDPRDLKSIAVTWVDRAQTG